ncbi:hypothetical protein [Pseudoduganella violaceinigra]|uniref:hypothetical protein n=1 Tax=Pseudoduganella violaceinigra TaxID=246602 RepID=UPI0012B58706|nr:hypothetical protein [Pseudoduganella violaceinigra]
MYIRRLCVCAAFALPAAASAAPIEVKTIAYKGALPYVVSDNPRRDARINHAIYLGVTGQPAPAKFSDGVKAPEDQDGGPGISEISYSLTRSDDRVLALELDYEGCGAYCEHQWDVYNFDAATGRIIFYSDLFTPQGGKALFQQNLAKRINEYRQAIAELNKEAASRRRKQGISTPWPQPRSDSKQDDEEARITETVDMYQRCIDSMRSPEYASYFTRENSPLKLEDSSITFLFGRCSNHAMRALDEVGDQQVVYSIAALAPHFTAYAKYLLMGGPPAAPRAEPYQQFLQGRVGQAAITLQLSRPASDGAVSGNYFYNKYRKPIALGGKVTGNAIELTEIASADSPKPLIRATIKGESLAGQWIGKKTLDFHVGP